MKKFGKENAALVVKGGLLDGKPLSPEEISKLADLESREVLLAKLAGAMKASMSGAAAMFAAPLSQAARTLGALQAKATEDPSILAGAGEAAPEDAATETTDGEEPAEKTQQLRPTTSRPMPRLRPRYNRRADALTR